MGCTISKNRNPSYGDSQNLALFVDVVRTAGASNVQLEVLDSDRLTESDEERFLGDIRMIPPQIRGRVRSGGGRTLPITGSSKLNHSIPILLIYDGPRPVDVFPKDLMGVKHDLNSAFKPPNSIGHTWR